MLKERWESCKERVDISDCSEQEIELDLEEIKEWMRIRPKQQASNTKAVLKYEREYGRFGFRRISRDRAQGNKQSVSRCVRNDNDGQLDMQLLALHQGKPFSHLVKLCSERAVVVPASAVC